MAQQSSDQDRNFDDLAERFKRNIYHSQKGDIRLAVLKRDLAEHLAIAPYVPLTPEKTWRVLDAGGGQGQLSLTLAAAGHKLTLCDLSGQMLARARARAERHNILSHVNFVHGAIQTLEQHIDHAFSFDLVLCHAVLEWVSEPEALLKNLVARVRPGGVLSLVFYNYHALVYKNLLRVNDTPRSAGEYGAHRGSLTPVNPQDPQAVLAQCRALGLEVLCHSGIRVFSDYLLDPEARAQDPQTIMALELKYANRSPYRELGRYQHLLVRAPEY